MDNRRLCQRLLIVVLAVFLVAGGGCGGTAPGGGAAQPQPGHWEGSDPSVSFEVTAEGTIRAFQLVGNIPMGRCTVKVDEIALDGVGGFALGDEPDAGNRLSGRLTSARTMAGTYEIKVCEGAGGNITVVLQPEEKAWSAEWKGPSVTMTAAPAGTVPATSISAPTSPPTAVPAAVATAAPAASPREGIYVGGSARVVPAEGLVLRQSPDLSAAIVALMNPGTVLDVIGGPQESAGLVWWQVRIQGSDQEGWAAAGGGGSVYLEPVPGP